VTALKHHPGAIHRSTSLHWLGLALLVASCATDQSVLLSPGVGGPSWAPDGTLGATTAVPHYEDGARVGVRLGPVGGGSLAEHLRLQPGDVILAFDTVPCDHLDACENGLQRVYAAVHRRRPFSLLIRRGDRRLRYRYTYPPLHRLELAPTGKHRSGSH